MVLAMTIKHYKNMNMMIMFMFLYLSMTNRDCQSFVKEKRMGCFVIICVCVRVCVRLMTRVGLWTSIVEFSGNIYLCFASFQAC